MFSRKTIAAVSALLGGLALSCTGAVQAHASGAEGGCARHAMGESTCVSKRQIVYTTKGGKHVVRQHKSCSSDSRHHVVWPESGLLNNGSTSVGQVMDCSNRAPAPKGFKLPRLF
ncbi:hypothetical protein ACWD6P_10260 [Streptomyces sp. NPDC002446]